MIGCLQHYKASVNRHSTLRLLRNDTGTDTEALQDLQNEFATMAWSLTKARTPRAAAAIAESITKRWPMLRHWCAFWTLPRILPMISRALSKMTPEERRLYPTTTNAVESAHKCLLHASASSNNKPAKGVHRVLDSVQFFIGLQVVAKTGNFTGSRLRSKGSDEDEKRVTAAARAVEKRKQVPRSYVPSGRPLDPFEAENRRPISHKAFMDKALLDSDDVMIVEVAVNSEYQNPPLLELVNDIVVEAAAEVERSSAPLENAAIPDPPSTKPTVEEEPRGTAAPPLAKAKGFVRTAPRRARNYLIKPVDPAAVVSGVRSSPNAPLASSTVMSQVHSMVNTSLLLVSRVTGTPFGTFAPDAVGVLQTSNNQNSCWLDSTLMAMMASWDALKGFLVSLEEPLRSHTNEGSTAGSPIVEVYNALRDFFRTYAGTIDDKASMTTAATRIDPSRDELRRLIKASLLAPGHGDHKTTGYANAVEWWQHLASLLFKLSKTTLPPQSTRMAETDWVLDVSLSNTVRWTPDDRSSDLVFRDDTGLEHRWSLRAVTQLRHQHISTKGGVAIGPDGELQWHQFDGLNPMGKPECAAITQCLSNKAMDGLAGIDDYRPRAICCANGRLLPIVAMVRQRYEVMGLELGVVEEGAQAGRQTCKKIREAGSARKYQIDKLRILEKAIGLHPGHSLFDEYRAHKPVMVKLRCPTCAAGGLCGTPVAFTQDLIRCNLCGLYLHKLRAEISKEEQRTTRCIICVNVVSTKDLRADELKKLSGTVNLQLVPGNKLAWSFSNAKQLAGIKNREIYLSLQVPTEAILKKTWGTNASLVKTFIKDTKKTFKHLNKLAAERYADNYSDEDGPVRHHYFPMLQKWYLFAMPLVQIIPLGGHTASCRTMTVV
ncbi:BQ5605_C014g07449 [Microbotryum silenes-dioicae]|uniref:BQ5605_C014g07449 protein n=1 Tax=Microbotryum silenes-dioicae TaxID=796604 RepID=A0A2X0MNB4_9BASI|nr:BQ5605_C014g07449 [Microbotryum silenes-dioicae]